jgi:hypothetical protein
VSHKDYVCFCGWETSSKRAAERHAEECEHAREKSPAEDRGAQRRQVLRDAESYLARSLERMVAAYSLTPAEVTAVLLERASAYAEAAVRAEVRR